MKIAGVTFSEFRSCSEWPEKNGMYFVIGLYEGRFTGYATIIEFTTRWGWNTGNTSHDSPIAYKDYDGHEYYWAEMTVNLKEDGV